MKTKFTDIDTAHHTSISVSPCGSYAAYVVGSHPYMLVVRQVSHKPYAIIYQKKLHSAEKTSTNNRLASFLKSHLIKGTSKSMTNESEPSNFSFEGNKGVQIKWEFDEELCERVAVLDRQNNSLFVTGLSDDIDALVVTYISTFGIDSFDWVARDHIAIWSANNILCRIINVSNPSSFYEVAKPKNTDVYNIKGTNCCTIVSRDNGNDFFETIDCGKNIEILSKLKLFTDCKQLEWSTTGKRCGFTDVDCNLYLTNSLGIGSNNKKQYLNSTFSINVASDITVFDISFSWGFLALETEVIDTNYPVLRKICEAVLVADNNDQLRIYTTHMGLQSAGILDHSLIAENDNTAYWKYIKEDFEREVMSQIPCSTAPQGLQVVKSELVTKYKELSTLKDQSFAVEYFTNLCQKSNLIAVKPRSLENIVYIWDISQIFELPSLSGVVETRNKIIDVEWHPVLPGILLIVTSTQLVVFSNHWKPMTIDMSTRITKSGWIKSSSVTVLKIECSGVNNSTVIEVYLEDWQLQPLRQAVSIENEVRNGNVAEESDGVAKSEDVEKARWFFEEEAAREDESFSVLVDDETANKIIKDVRHREWGRLSKGEADDDTFKFKRRKI